MTTTAAQLDVPLEPLTQKAFDAFCEDITSMFGNTAECVPGIAGQGALSVLKKEFKKIASVNHVQALGTLNGTFQLLLDQAGMFVLAGVFVMLPEKRILETIRNGTLKDADYINDAIKEVGNLLVGSWDRIFREELQGHKHFKQTGTFVGPLWEDVAQSIGLTTEQPCRYVICNMKVDEFPEFKCAAVFSESFFETQDVQPQTPAPTVSVADVPATNEIPQTTSEQTPAVIPPPAEEPAAVQTPVTEPSAESAVPQMADSQEPISTETCPGPVAQAISQLTQSKAVQISGLGLETLTAADVMHQGVLWVSPEDTIEDVLRQMQQHNAGYVLVGREGLIEGLVSRSDVNAAVSPYLRSMFAQWRRPLDDATLQIRVKWFMSRPVHTIRPEATLLSVMEMMMRQSVRGLPVVDANGRTMGLVTVYEIFTAVLGGAGRTSQGRPQQAPPMIG